MILNMVLEILPLARSADCSSPTVALTH